MSVAVFLGNTACNSDRENWKRWWVVETMVGGGNDGGGGCGGVV